MGIIRFALALIVLVLHLNMSGLEWGTFWVYTVVNSFFIISGFYMALILTEKYTRHKNRYWLFITNRMLRIFPLYWIILSATIVYELVLFNTNILGQLSFFDYISNFTLLIRTDYFNTIHHQPYILGVAWSLVVELIFYLVAPFFIKRSTKTLTVLLVLSFFMRFAIISFFTHRYHSMPAQMFFPPYLVFFILGICSHRLYLKLKNHFFLKQHALSFFVYMFGATLFFFKLPSIIPFYGVETSGWLYYISLFICIPALFIFSKKNAIDKFLGELSFPIYLSHVLIITMYKNVMGNATNPIFTLLITIVLTIAVSALLDLFITRPLNRYRQKRLLYITPD